MAVDGRLKVLFHGTGEASWCPGIAVITTAQSRIENNGAALRHRRECFRLDSGDFLMLSFSASDMHDLSSSQHCPFGGQGPQNVHIPAEFENILVFHLTRFSASQAGYLSSIAQEPRMMRNG